jgi:hypothetical protein
MMGLLPLVIELGNFRLHNDASLSEFGWFVAGVIFLTGLSALVLWWNRRAQPDPFL